MEAFVATLGSATVVNSDVMPLTMVVKESSSKVAGFGVAVAVSNLSSVVPT